MTIGLELSFSSSKGRAAVVAPPHPLYGGHMDNPVVTTVATALERCGYAPLRFNWRGVGESSGRPSGRIEDAVEDYRTAVAEARRRAGSPRTPVLAAGYSFGAIAALVAALTDEAGVERFVLVAPPVQMLDAVDVASVDVPLQVIVGQRDQYADMNALADALAAAREARLDVIPDADHFFGFAPWLDKLAELVSSSLS